MITFDTHPDRYRHWRLSIEGPVAVLALDVDEEAPLAPGYQLKLNSYDLGVDIELADAVSRLRFEHSEVGAVIVTSAKTGVFCAGANIRMLAEASHPFKVGFCKFTNETRLAMEDASRNSGQVYLSALSGAASGGGYELALATEHILLADDGASAVSFPEVPLLGVLPGTGGLTRLVDKRHVRRDLADVVATTAEGVRGRRALDWGLVDELCSRSRLEEVARARALELAARSDRPAGSAGLILTPLERELTDQAVRYRHVRVDLDRPRRLARVTVRGPDGPLPTEPAAILELGAGYWPLAVARQLDDAILHLRFNELELGTLVLGTEGDPAGVAAVDEVLSNHAGHWLVREIVLLWARVLRRLDISSRSLVALVEPGSCFAGTLVELVLLADRSFMLDTPASELWLTAMNFGSLPMGNGLSRLATRFLGRPEHLEVLAKQQGERLSAAEAAALGLITFTPDDLDWDDQIRLALEERASFSPDALTGMEASLRFPGPETLETKIFGRLSSWQNWIFLRPNAAGEQGALRRFGTGRRAEFDMRRV